MIVSEFVANVHRWLLFSCPNSRVNFVVAFVNIPAHFTHEVGRVIGEHDVEVAGLDRTFAFVQVLQAVIAEYAGCRVVDLY